MAVRLSHERVVPVLVSVAVIVLVMAGLAWLAFLGVTSFLSPPPA